MKFECAFVIVYNRMRLRGRFEYLLLFNKSFASFLRKQIVCNRVSSYFKQPHSGECQLHPRSPEPLAIIRTKPQAPATEPSPNGNRPHAHRRVVFLLASGPATRLRPSDRLLRAAAPLGFIRCCARHGRLVQTPRRSGGGPEEEEGDRHHPAEARVAGAAGNRGRARDPAHRGTSSSSGLFVCSRSRFETSRSRFETSGPTSSSTTSRCRFETHYLLTLSLLFVCLDTSGSIKHESLWQFDFKRPLILIDMI
jgi:hypothetical protein